MAIIESLTPEQEALLDVYADRWVKIGLSTAPADRPRAERALARMYEVAGMQAPKMSWAGSPYTMLGKDVSAAVAGGVAAAQSPSQGPRGTLSDVVFGAHDAGWLSYFAYCREVLGLCAETEELVPALDLARSCGWCLVLEDRAILSERHNVLHLDPQTGLPHNLVGPAIAYPDGWSLYIVRGVSVPRGWVEQRESLDVRLALEHPNVEERAAAAELIGWDRVLRELKSRVVDVERDPNYDYGKLLEVDLPDEPGQKFLQVLCATGRTMVLRVPPEMTSARQANAWSNGFDRVEDFRPEGRT